MASSSSSIENAGCLSEDFQQQNDQRLPSTSMTPRVLSADERMHLDTDAFLVDDFKQNKLAAQTKKHWNIFYRRNKNNFFKDRHWTKVEFQQLCPDLNWQCPLVLLEVGCGVGNLVFPLLEAFPNLFVVCCDFAKNAIELLKQNEAYNEEKCRAFVHDLTVDDLSSSISPGTVDVITVIFCLSAIHSSKMVAVLKSLLAVLKPGGSVIFRDYGLNDFAMVRLSHGQKLEENAYVRQDGTYTYFFSLEKASELFATAGFIVSFCEYVHKEMVNRKENLQTTRVFAQGVFRKPASC